MRGSAIRCPTARWRVQMCAGRWKCALGVAKPHICPLPRHAGMVARCAGVIARHAGVISRCAGMVPRYRRMTPACHARPPWCEKALFGEPKTPPSAPRSRRTVPRSDSSAPRNDSSVPWNRRRVPQNDPKNRPNDARPCVRGRGVSMHCLTAPGLHPAVPFVATHGPRHPCRGAWFFCRGIRWPSRTQGGSFLPDKNKPGRCRQWPATRASW